MENRIEFLSFIRGLFSAEFEPAICLSEVVEKGWIMMMMLAAKKEERKTEGVRFPDVSPSRLRSLKCYVARFVIIIFDYMLRDT